MKILELTGDGPLWRRREQEPGGNGSCADLRSERIWRLTQGQFRSCTEVLEEGTCENAVIAVLCKRSCNLCDGPHDGVHDGVHEDVHCADLPSETISHLTQGQFQNCADAIAATIEKCAHSALAAICHRSCRMCDGDEAGHEGGPEGNEGRDAPDCSDLPAEKVSQLTQGRFRSCEEAITEGTCANDNVAPVCRYHADASVIH